MVDRLSDAMTSVSSRGCRASERGAVAGDEVPYGTVEEMYEREVVRATRRRQQRRDFGVPEVRGRKGLSNCSKVTEQEQEQKHRRTGACRSVALAVVMAAAAALVAAQCPVTVCHHMR